MGKMIKSFCLRFFALLFTISSLCAHQVLHAGNESAKNPEEQTLLLLIRHGETDWNTQQLYLGRTNIPLNDTGIEQAKKLADYLIQGHPDILAIYSSNLDRASATALYTGQKFDLHIFQTPQLREIDFGVAEGLPVEEIDILYREEHTNLLTVYPNREERWKFPIFPGAESYHDLLSRVRNELQFIAESHPGGKIAVFVHGRIIRTLISESLNYPDLFPALPNCAIAHFLFSKTKSYPFTFLKTEKPQGN